jgi:uncharacterized Ntn-hydrolase superfamily protein
LRKLGEGKSAEEVVAGLTGADSEKAVRQLAVLGVGGKPAVFTGSGCLAWAGAKVGEHYAVQGNILAGEAVVEGMAKAFEEGSGTLAERMLAALEAGQKAGGDRRGMQSAALLVVREGWGYGWRTMLRRSPSCGGCMISTGRPFRGRRRRGSDLAAGGWDYQRPLPW